MADVPGLARFAPATQMKTLRRLLLIGQVVYHGSGCDFVGDGMVIHLNPELEAALIESARRLGIAPEVLAMDALRACFLSAAGPIQPRDEWERRLIGAASDCGVSLPDAALGSDGLYESWPI